MHILLAAVIIAAFAVWGNGRDPAAAARHVTLLDPQVRHPVQHSALSIVHPPGTVVLDTTEKEHGEPPAAVLQPQDVGLLEDKGAVAVKVLITRDDDLTQALWQISIADGHDPRQALLAVDGLYASAGYRLAPDPPAGVLIRTQPAVEVPGIGTLTVFRAHYVTGPHLIRIEAYGPNRAEATNAFDELMARQLDRWPPT